MAEVHSEKAGESRRKTQTCSSVLETLDNLISDYTAMTLVQYMDSHNTSFQDCRELLQQSKEGENFFSRITIDDESQVMVMQMKRNAIAAKSLPSLM